MVVPSHKQEMPLAKGVAKLFTPLLEKYYRAQFIGLEHIPNDPFLAVGNHLGVYFMPETYLWLGKYHSLEGKPPMKVLIHHALHEMASFARLPEKQFGVLDACPSNTIRALEEGNAVTVYPGGDRENSKSFCDRNKIDFFGHKGYVQMALKAQVPILPVVGIGGGETLFVLSSGERLAQVSGIQKLFRIHTWPIYWSLPFGWKVGHLPYPSLPLPAQVTVSVLPPISTKDYSPEDADDPHVVNEINHKVIQSMQLEMDRLAKGRVPVLGKLK